MAQARLKTIRTTRDHGRQEALQRGRPEVPPDGLLGARLRAEGHGHRLPVPHHPAGRRRSDRSRRGSGRRVEHRDLDGGVDRSADRLRQLPRQGLQGRSRCPASPGQFFAWMAYDIILFEEGSIANMTREPDRQRLRLQAPQGGAPGGHAHPGRLPQDLRGSADRARSSSASASTSSAGRCSAPPPNPSSDSPAATTAAWSTRRSRAASIS